VRAYWKARGSRGWKAGQRANIDALTMQANYVLVRAWLARPRQTDGDVGGVGCVVVACSG